MRQQLTNAKRWVVKVGSSSVTNNGLGLDFAAIAGWAEQLVALQSKGIQIVLVSSGAVAEGVARLGLNKRPTQIHLQQAAAAVGQMGLVQAYESCFQKHGIHSAQILLTHEDLSDRTRYLNARSTLSTLLDMGVIPVVNENDTVATSELCFGDNDTLAALVANLINADVMILLTDQSGLFDADPRVNSKAKLIKVGSSNDPQLTQIAGGSSALGKGGMQTKVRAAKLAARSGTDTVIAEGKLSHVITRLAQGEDLGTLLLADSEPVTARKQWLAAQLGIKGRLFVDDGAVRVLQHSGKSLLAAGIKRIEGSFSRGDLVACVDQQGQEIARGLTNYGSEEVSKIRGHNSDQIESVLGYGGDEEVIHRDNLVLR